MGAFEFMLKEESRLCPSTHYSEYQQFRVLDSSFQLPYAYFEQNSISNGPQVTASGQMNDLR